MCGITGLLNIKGSNISQRLIDEMNKSISHRGPDNNGSWVKNNIGLGHQRLAIIDISSQANQPMVSNNKRWVLTYNGEIYNFKEIKKELEKEGFYFRTKSDTEVVLNALSYWGEKALNRFNGMFALALWDRDEECLLLARDRYGIKPLYYSLFDNHFLFASEQKALLTYKDFQKNLDKEALVEYFTFQNILTNKTLIKDISLLQSGHYLKIKKKNNYQIEHTKYWDYNFNEIESKMSRLEYEEELDRLFNQAVKRQLVTDVEIGAYLSGGIDSGSITSIASRHIKNIKSFTCGFDTSSANGIELNYDERDKAEAMSAIYKTEHYEMVLKSGDMERSLPHLTKHLEEPRVGQSYPNYFAAKLTSKFVKVVLSGTGGDELFAGYPWRYYSHSGCKNFKEYIDEYFINWQRLLDPNELKLILSPIWHEINHIDPKEIFSNVFLSHKNKFERREDFINHSLYFEAKTFLHGLFIVEDKLSMAHGLETRVPFMDNDIVEFAMQCPLAYKLKNLNSKFKINENQSGLKTSNYFLKTNDGKKILRDVMKKYVPENIINAKKQGFSSPDASWFRGESIEFVKRKLYNKNSVIYEFLNYKNTTEIVSQHIFGKKNRRLLIWSLLNFEEFIKQFIN